MRRISEPAAAALSSDSRSASQLSGQTLVVQDLCGYDNRSLKRAKILLLLPLLLLIGCGPPAAFIAWFGFGLAGLLLGLLLVGAAAFVAARAILYAIVYLTVFALLVIAGNVGPMDGEPKGWGNLYKLAMLRALGASLVMATSTAAYHRYTGVALPVAGLTIFVFLFVFALQLGHLFVLAEKENVQARVHSICRDTDMWVLDRERMYGLLDPLRQSQRAHYFSFLVSPFIALTMVKLGHLRVEQMFLWSFAIGTLLMIGCIVASVSIDAWSLSTPLPLPKKALTWQGFKNLYSAYHDARTVFLYDGFHSILIAVCYGGAILMFGAGDALTPRGVAVRLLILILAGTVLSIVLLLVPFFIGHRLTVSQALQEINRTTALSAEDYDKLENELVALRAPIPASVVVRFILPVITAGGALIAVATTLMQVAVK